MSELNYPALVLPDITAESVLGVDFGTLAKEGRTNIFIDLDLTLRKHQLARTCVPEIVEYLFDNQEAGNISSITLATNSRFDMRPFAEQLKSTFIQPFRLGDECIKKPDPRFFRTALESRGVEPSSAVMIGDRYLLDVVGAACVGMTTILVEPLAVDYPLDILRRARRKDRAAYQAAKDKWATEFGNA